MEVNELLQKYACGQRNFIGVKLEGMDLSWVNLPEINLCQACLELSILEGVDLSQTNLTQACLSRADLTAANLSRANLQCANLENADLRGANLSYVDLTDANLNGADLTGANLTGATLPQELRALLFTSNQCSNSGENNRVRFPCRYYFKEFKTLSELQSI